VVALGNNHYQVQASHTYASDSFDQPAGSFTITIQVSDPAGDVISETHSVIVVRPPMAMQAANVLPNNGLTVSNQTVAVFEEADTSDTASEFQATVHWGDGTTSTGTISGSNGLFQVQGSHTYATSGVYVTEVDLSQGWSSSVLALVGTGLVLPLQGFMGLRGPEVVPGNSTYIYQVSGLNGPYQWALPPGVAATPLSGSTKSYYVVQFQNTPGIVKVTVKVGNGGLNLTLPVIVAQIDVRPGRPDIEPKAKDPAKALSGFRISTKVPPVYVPTFNPGSDVTKFTFTGQTLDSEPSVSVVPAAPPLIDLETQVEVLFPAGTTDAQAKLIRLGYVQGVTQQGSAAYKSGAQMILHMFTGMKTADTTAGGPFLDWLSAYPGLTRSYFVKQFQGAAPFEKTFKTPQVVLDKRWFDPKAFPWYPLNPLKTAGSYWIPSGAEEGTKGKLVFVDSPSGRLPEYFDGQNANPEDKILSGTVTDNFNLYVAAAAVGDLGTSPWVVVQNSAPEQQYIYAWWAKFQVAAGKPSIAAELDEKKSGPLTTGSEVPDPMLKLLATPPAMLAFNYPYGSWLEIQAKKK
jgi:hypothetical protein